MTATLEIIARSPQWIAVAKPSGLPSRPAPSHSESALSLLEAWLRGNDPGPHPPGVVHRLDRETSGVLLFSLDPQAHRRLVGAFAAGQVCKEYVAFVRGSPKPRRGRIDLPLIRNASGIVVVDARGRPARTRYETVRAWPGAAWLRVQPLTGRMHQIRAHLAARGTPILGDRLYGRGGAPRAVPGLAGRARDAGVPPDAPDAAPLLPRPPRLCLHAARLAFSIDADGALVEIEAPLPEDLRRYLKRLSRSLSR
jgi:RluA family pseudouridine synthase